MYSLIIVDDELKIREGLVNLIPWEQNSFQVVGQFSNGKQALEFIKNKQVDVVLTDIRMPIMSGIELSDCLSKEYPDILFVFLTGYQDFSYMHTAIINHAFDYLLKPIKYEALYTCFERLRTKLDEIHHQFSPAVCENSSYYGKIIAEVCSYLDTQYQTATLDTAAAIVNLSPNYLSKLFKDKAQMGFSEYLNEVRMKKPPSYSAIFLSNIMKLLIVSAMIILKTFLGHSSNTIICLHESFAKKIFINHLQENFHAKKIFFQTF